jgi:hypothetical protein
MLTSALGGHVAPSSEGMETHRDDGYTHQREELFTLFVVFFGHSDLSTRQTVYVFCGT